MNTRGALLNGRDGNIRVVACGFGFFEAIDLVGFPGLLDRDFIKRLHVQRMMEAELIFPRTVGDLTTHPESIREFVKLDICHVDFNVHRFSFTASIPERVVIPLDPPGGLASHGVTGLDDVL